MKKRANFNHQHGVEKVMANNRKVLVLGASGGIGGEVARQLRDAGWQVRALKRDATKNVEERDGIQWLRGDALKQQDVLDAASGCSVIVHAVNPPGYRRWAEQVLPMLNNTIAAAVIERATIVLPGTIYNYGPDAFPMLSEESPQHPVTRKGGIRVEMERHLRKASRAGARTLIVRAGDFFGPQAGNNWFSQALVKPGKPVAFVNYPGQDGIGHQWAFLPDVAHTMVELLARRDSLDAFSSFHMAGHWDEDGTRMCEAIRSVAQRHLGVAPRVSAFPWGLLTLVSPFVKTFMEMREMRYLWRAPIRLDNSRLLATLGHEPHTPLEAAVEVTLEGLGCLKTSGDRFDGASAA
jgi:nucleoside-diphosphate-sugar epimerase